MNPLGSDAPTAPSSRALTWSLMALGVALLLLAGVVIFSPDVRQSIVGWWLGDEPKERERGRRTIRDDGKGEARLVSPEEFADLMGRGAGRVPRPKDLRSPEENRKMVARSDEGKVCLKFVDAVNGKTPPADLLGAAPSVPKEVISPEEAGRLDAEFILRRSYCVEDVRLYPAGPNGEMRFLLVLKGGGNSETMRVRTKEGKIEEGRRILSNPDIIVEVRDGKIYGVKAQAHTW